MREQERQDRRTPIVQYIPKKNQIVGPIFFFGSERTRPRIDSILNKIKRNRVATLIRIDQAQ